MARVAVRHVAEVFECRAAFCFPSRGKLHYPTRSSARAVAARARTLGSRSGWSITAASGARHRHACRPRRPCTCRLGDAEARLACGGAAWKPTTCHAAGATPFAGNLRRADRHSRWSAPARRAGRDHARRRRGESLRNALLASISHDLRTPLAVMAGAASTLAAQGAALDEATRKSLARSIETKAHEMSTHLQCFGSGALRVRPDHAAARLGAPG